MIWGGPEEESKMDLFFPRKCLLRMIFSWRRPLEVIFSWRRASEIFFSRFPPALPQIINGHLLSYYFPDFLAMSVNAHMFNVQSRVKPDVAHNKETIPFQSWKIKPKFNKIGNLTQHPKVH